jgi:hypothetical protein
MHFRDYFYARPFSGLAHVSGGGLTNGGQNRIRPLICARPYRSGLQPLKLILPITQGVALG